MAEIEIRRKKDSRGALTLPSVSVSYPHVLDPGSEKFKKKKISTEFQNIFYKYTVSLKNVLAYLDKIKEQQFCIAKKRLTFSLPTQSSRQKRVLLLFYFLDPDLHPPCGSETLPVLPTCKANCIICEKFLNLNSKTEKLLSNC